MKPLQYCYILFFIFMLSCSRRADDYRDYQGGFEIVYPGVIKNPRVHPGNGRIMLSWNPNSDPTISRYKIYWNNKADSLEVAATTNNPSDTVKVIVPNLNELLSYNFEVYSFDGKGNRSVVTALSNVKIYGDQVYRVQLSNRKIRSWAPGLNRSDLLINWSVPDTVNITTQLKYATKSGNDTTIYLAAGSTDIRAANWQAGKAIKYRSAYRPTSLGIDTFWVTKLDSLVLTAENLIAGFAGSFQVTGTLQRTGLETALLNETKNVSYQGAGVYKFQIAPSVFNNANLQVYFTINNDNTVTILPQSGSEGGLSVVADGPCTFEPQTNTLNLKYMYMSGVNFRKFDEKMVKR